MKTRAGFVSNSSSSSFVVSQYRDAFASSPVKILTKEQETQLKENGFKLTSAVYPFQVDVAGWADSPENEEDFKYANWTQYVSCNQDDVIEFLLKSRISFTADIHYGHSSMIYNGETDELLIAQNYGMQAQMSGREHVNFAPPKNSRGVEKITGKIYLKNNKL